MKITFSNQNSPQFTASVRRNQPLVVKEPLEAALHANDVAAATVLSHAALQQLNIVPGGPNAVNKLRAAVASRSPEAMNGATLYAECVLLGFGPHDTAEAKDGALAAHKAAAFLMEQTSQEATTSGLAPSGAQGDADFFASLPDLPERTNVSAQPAYVEHETFVWTHEEMVADAGMPNLLRDEPSTPSDLSPTTPRFDDQFFTRLRSPSLPTITLDMPALSMSPRLQKIDGFVSQSFETGTISLQDIDMAARFRRDTSTRPPTPQRDFSPASVHATPEPEPKEAVRRKRKREATEQSSAASGAAVKKRGPKPVDMAQRPYGCDHCEWRFARKEHLRRHMSSVNRELKFKCTFDYCDRRFPRSDNRDQHSRTHEQA